MRTPNQRPKSWKQQNDDYTRNAEAKPFQCIVLIHPGKESRIYAENVVEFWADIQVAADHSLYRDFAGIRIMGKDQLILPNDQTVQPGKYHFASRTIALSNQGLERVIAHGVEILREQRPLKWDAVKRVQSQLLLHYNHFSLSHEGNSMTLDETRMVFDMVIGNDWKHKVEADEVGDKMQALNESKNDVREARNHIFVSEQLQALSQYDVTETLVLQLHSWTMSGLLEKEDEGLPGEYRKVAIGVMGSSKGRPPSADVPPLMKKFFAVSMVKKEKESLLEYLARIHSEFQDIHPFRDGNGRIGRLIINLILLKHGYPLLVLPTTLSSMFNHAVDMGTQKKLELFTRLLGEALFRSLQIYEDALQDVKLLPQLEDVIGLKVIDGSVPRVVSP